VVEGNARRDGLLLDVTMVRDHGHDLRVELAAAPAPQHLLQTVVVARHEDRDALVLPPPAELPVHRKASGDLGVEALLQRLPLEWLLEEELGAQEEPATGGIRGVLVGGDDVGSPLEQKA